MTVTRAGLLRGGVAGTLLIAAARCTRLPQRRSSFADDEFAYRVFSPAHRAIAASICSAILAGALPQNEARYREALVDAVRGFDTAVAGLQPNVQTAVVHLFALLESPVTRLLTTGIGSSIADADPSAVAAFLGRWRYGRHNAASRRL